MKGGKKNPAPSKAQGTPRPQRPASILSRLRERFTIPVLIGFPIVCIVVVSVLVRTGQWRRSIDARLTKWQSKYHLTDEAVARAREIELEFHGSGNPFTSPIKRSAIEVQKHHEELSTLMSEAEALIFLRDMNSHHGDH